MEPRPPESIDLGEAVLRRLRPDDAVAMSDATSSCISHLAPWMVWATPDGVSVEAMARFIAETTARSADGSEVVYAVVTRGEGPPGRAGRAGGPRDGDAGDEAERIVGGCGLHDRGTPRTVEIGYWLHPDVTGRGLMSRIVATLTDLALDMDDVDAAAIVCDQANGRSAAVPRRLGFRLDRIVDSPRPQAPAETGRDMIWLRTDPI